MKLCCVKHTQWAFIQSYNNLLLLEDGKKVLRKGKTGPMPGFYLVWVENCWPKLGIRRWKELFEDLLNLGSMSSDITLADIGKVVKKLLHLYSLRQFSSRVLERRLVHCQTKDCQAKFFPGYGTVDQIFILVDMLRSLLEFDHPV